MQVFVGLLVLAGLYLGFVAWPYLHRVVIRISVPSPGFDQTVESWLRSGCKGFGIFICHPPSGTVVNIRKAMPDNVPEAKVSLYVGKLRLANKRFAPRAYRYRQIRGYECAVMWCWQLPSLRRAEVLEKVRCLGSLERVFHALYRMLSEEGAIGQNEDVVLWCTPGKSWFTGSQFGAFDD